MKSIILRYFYYLKFQLFCILPIQEIRNPYFKKVEKVNYRTIILLILISVISFNLSAMNYKNDPGLENKNGVTMERNPESDNTPRYNMRVFIKVHKVIYEQQEPVFIRFFVKNQERKNIDLKIAAMDFLNFTFTVKNLKNQMIGERNTFYLYKRRNSDNRNYRTIRLAPGDIYGKTIDISKLFRLDKIGYYIIQGYFYPVPYGFHDINHYPSNKIRIQIRYGKRRMRVARELKKRMMHDLQRKRSPYETIEFILNSKLRKNWKHFFRYIDLDRLIEIYPDYYKQYRDVRPSKRIAVLNKFKEYLKNYLEEQMVAHEVYRTIINREDAKVFTNIIYRYRGSKFKKRYVFRLYRRGKYWYLYHFYVMNLKLTRQELRAVEEREKEMKNQRPSQERPGVIPRYD